VEAEEIPSIFKQVAEIAWAPQVRATMARVREQGREPGRLYHTLANAPATLDAWVEFATSIRTDMQLPRAVRELVIIRVGQLTDSTYEVRQHSAMALAQGVSISKVERLHVWRNSPEFDARERACLECCERMVLDNQVNEPTWQLLSSSVNAQEAVELVVTVAFYCMVSKVLAAWRII
jgi:alkylhydroperoxidase family enzyme